MRRTVRTSWLLLLLFVSLMFWTGVIFTYRSGQLLSKCIKSTTELSVVSHSLAPVRRVTKSLAELGKMDERNAHIVFFNAVPKSGSELVVLLLQWLQGWNNFRHVRLKGGTARSLTRLQQEQLVYETYDIIKNEAVPLTFDRHVYFINFTSFDKQSPTYINLVRNPVDMVVSRFSSQYLKTHTSIKPKTVRNKYVLNSFRQCLKDKLEGCYFSNGKSYDLVIPYFCGHEERCRILNDDWALQTAKLNVERYYSVVGVLEELNVTLEVLESKMTYFFKGVQKLYNDELLKVRRGKHKKMGVSRDIKAYLQSTLRTEWEFYEWLKSRLFGQLQIIYGTHNHAD